MSLPIDNLDDKRYNDFIDEALKQIPVYAPQWTNFNPSDPGITLIELFSWLSEMQLYQLNKLPEALYMKFLKLTGIRSLNTVQPAHVKVTFTPKDNSQIVIPPGTRVIASFPGGDISFETIAELTLTGKPQSVKAIQTHSHRSELFSSNGLPGISLQLKDVPILSITVKIKDENKPMPDEWQKVDDLDASQPGDTHFSAHLSTGTIGFGNGMRGKIPAKGNKNIYVQYTTSNGQQGNVLPQTIKGIMAENLAQKVTVINNEAASGGKDPETLAQAILRLRKDLATIHRAITPQDYEGLVLDMPGKLVARVKAIPSYHPLYPREMPGLVTVVVVPGESVGRNIFHAGIRHGWGFFPTTLANLAKLIPAVTTQALLKKIYHYLEKRRLLTTRLLVIPAHYETINVKSTVVINPEHLRSTIERTAKDTLDKFFHPLTGGPEGTGWPFGRPVYLSEIYNIIHHIDGVDYVKNLKLARGNTRSKAKDITIPRHSLITSGKHVITVLENYDQEGALL
jgi:predicted phage baseplate assembly protein